MLLRFPGPAPVPWVRVSGAPLVPAPVSVSPVGITDAQPLPVPVPAPRVRAAGTQRTPAPVPTPRVGVAVVRSPWALMQGHRLRPAKDTVNLRIHTDSPGGSG